MRNNGAWFRYDDDNPVHRALRAKANPARRPEEQEQRFVIQWAELNRPRHPELEDLLHLANEGTGSKGRGGVMKAMGVRAGASDLFLPAPRRGWAKSYAGLFIEMKAVGIRPGRKPLEQELRLGKVSPDQLGFLQRMISRGYAASIAWDREDAQRDIEAYLSGDWVQHPIHECLGGRVSS